MSFTVQITLGLALILATCGYLEGASYKRHIRQTPEVPEYGTKLAQINLTNSTSDYKNAEQNIPNKGFEEPLKKDVLWKTTPTPKVLLKKQAVNLNPTQRALSESHETYEDFSAEKTVQKITSKSYDTSTAASSQSVEENPKKVAKLSLEKDHVKAEETQTLKPDKSRAIPFDTHHEDINKYTSEDFHNRNNVYTQQTSLDIEKYVNLAPENDTKTAFTQQLSSTAEYDYNYSEYTEITTPKTDYFDAKFKTIADGVKQNLAYHDKIVAESERVEKDNLEGKVEEFKYDESKLIDTANKDNKTTLDYLKYKTVSANNANKSNGVRKDFTSENGTSIDFRSSYLKSDVIDQKTRNDYSNQIPNSNRDQESSGSEYTESVNQVKVDEIDKNEKPAVFHQLVKNKTALLDSLKAGNGARRLSNVAPISLEEEPSSIDPLTTENVSESSINVYKRGSTKVLAPTVETTTSASIDNNINFDNKSFSIPPTGTAWTLAGLRDVPVASTTEQIRLHLKNTTKETESSKVAYNYTTVVPIEKHLQTSTNTTNDATKATMEKSADMKLDDDNRTVITTTTSTTPRSVVVAKAVPENATKTENSTKNATELITNNTKDISDVDMSDEKDEDVSGKERIRVVVTTTSIAPQSSSQENDSKQDISNLRTTENTSSKQYPDDYVLPTAETSADYSILNHEESLETNISSTLKPMYSDEASTEEIASSTEIYTTTATDYEDISTTVMADQNNTLAPYYSTTGSEYEQIGSTTDSSSETTTNLIPLYSTTASGEADEFTTILTTATTENVTEITAEDKNPNPHSEKRNETVANLTVPTTAVPTVTTTMKTTVTTTAKPFNVTSSTNSIDNVDMDDENDDAEEELDEEHKSQHGSQNTTTEPTGGADPEIEIIPYQPVDGEHPTVSPETKHGYQPPVIEPKVNNASAKNGTSVNAVPVKPVTTTPDIRVETTTVDVTSTDTDPQTSSPDEDNSGTIAAIVISCIGAVCLVILAILLIIMRKRQKRFNHLQRCTPINLDDYSLDNVSVYNSVSARRKGVCRGSKRSYGNPAFDDPVSVTRPLNFPSLAKFAENTEQIHAEFEEIPQVSARTSELPDGCETKNRYANVIPLPETRVFLETNDNEPNSDYINANYVTGPHNARGYYIACQAPMQETVDDFWRMIWEQQTKVILMLTNLYENGVEKCADYLPPSEVLDCHRMFGDYQITLKKREVKEKYIISSLQLKNMVSNSWREVTHLWYLGWPDRGVPSEANSIIAFLIEARSFLKFNVLDVHRAITKPTSPDGSNGTANGHANTGLASNRRIPVVVHCSPGTGRTGAVIACDIAIRDFEQTRQVDIPRTVYRIRRDRASAVQTKDQYSFIYKVLNLYATKLTGNALEAP